MAPSLHTPTHSRCTRARSGIACPVGLPLFRQCQSFPTAWRETRAGTRPDAMQGACGGATVLGQRIFETNRIHAIATDKQGAGSHEKNDQTAAVDGSGCGGGNRNGRGIGSARHQDRRG
ncbi:hypothetical protein D7S65_13390 [Ralstonia insidiosa]|nr:hypothetical protein [Ralstonia insidiosa]MBA9937133.1 hypothetical protein [Ralstonia insidiosa]MBA9952462.1 hypothetical protein [Ralstonia insidiosa]MBA9968837.1 hypothetical protein [Ralstonia insidiosa]